MPSQTVFFFVKAAVSGVLIAAVSALAKTFPKWAALLTALPLVTLLSLIWIYVENRDLGLLARYTQDVLVWTIPSLLFFAAAIYLFRLQIPFVLTLGISMAVLALGVFLFQRLHILK